MRGIAAAEIQSPEPRRLAARWSELLERPLSGDSTITLDNAWLRFVEASDGRGEGLGGVDLLAADRAAVVEAAARRGLLGTDGVVLLGGVRFRLVGVGPG